MLITWSRGLLNLAIFEYQNFAFQLKIRRLQAGEAQTKLLSNVN